MMTWYHHLAALSVLFALAGCPDGPPPPYFPIGTNDGNGGAEFNLGPGDPLRNICMPIAHKGPNDFWCPPSVLRNMWMTTPKGAEDLLKWCYDTRGAAVGAQ